MRLRATLRVVAAVVLIPWGGAGAAVRAQTPPPNLQIVDSSRGLSLHKDNFVLPFTWSEDYHGRRSEVVFQLSAKHRIFGTRFFFGYTQLSFWQAYDYGNSAPFRDTNYNPEIFYRFPTTPYRGGRIGLDAGAEHESNGQLVPSSRSWNQLYLTPHYQRGRFLVRVRLRYRIPEDPKESPEAAEGDDNPDITDYLGHTDLEMHLRTSAGDQLQLRVRGNLRTRRGFVWLTYGWRVANSDDTYIFAQASHGYGESLLDYNRLNTRVGAGIMFSR